MKPKSFEYLAPQSLDEALKYLNEYGEDAKILAGGQSLVALMNMRLANPQYVVDLNRVGELSFIREEDGKIEIGAMTRHAQVEESELVKEKAPLLAQAAQYIGHFQIRNRGTIGGSIAHADPTAEWPTVCTALDADIEVTNSDGVRAYKPEEFFLTYLTTNLAQGDIVTKISFPIVSGRIGSSFTELSRRHGDFAIVAVACQIELADDDTVKDIRVSLAGVEPVAYRARSLEEHLMSKKITESLIDEAVEMLKSELDPESDIHASAEYRREMAGEYTKRAIRKALEKI